MIPNGTASADGWQQKPALSDVWSDRAGFFEVVRKGEGWKYMMEDRCMFTGDKPIQTNGGRCHYGHAAAASGTHDIYEVCMQMRGEAGDHQIDRPIKHAMLRGFGGGQNLLCLILKYH